MFEALQYPFIQHALTVALILGATCAVLSCFLVLKGWSLMADAIAHAVLPGVWLAYWAGLPIALGAFGAGLSCALGTQYLSERLVLKSDTLLGIVFSGLFALGIFLSASSTHLSHLLFGHLLGINRAQSWQIIVISVGVLIFIGLKWRDLMLFVFDPTQARLSGLAVRRLGLILLILLTLMTVLAMQIVGVILVVAMLIAPALSAQLITKRFSTMIFVAVGLSIIASFFGVLLSVRWNSATGATIVLIQALLFLILLGVRQLKRLTVF